MNECREVNIIIYSNKLNHTHSPCYQFGFYTIYVEVIGELSLLLLKVATRQPEAIFLIQDSVTSGITLRKSKALDNIPIYAVHSTSDIGLLLPEILQQLNLQT